MSATEEETGAESLSGTSGIDMEKESRRTRIGIDFNAYGVISV